MADPDLDDHRRFFHEVYSKMARPQMKKYLAGEGYRRLRETVLRRDGGKCVVCKKPANDVHHAVGRTRDIRRAADPDNLISLCAVDHANITGHGLRIARGK